MMPDQSEEGEDPRGGPRVAFQVTGDHEQGTEFTQ